MAIDITKLQNIKGNFTPLTYEEMARPIQNMTTGLYLKSQMYSNAELETANMGLSKEEYDTYLKPTMNKIREASNNLTKYGLEGSGGVNEYLRLQREYIANVAPVKRAQQSRLANMDLQLNMIKSSKNPNELVFKRRAQDVPIEEYINNPNLMLTDSFNADDIRGSVSANLIPLKKAALNGDIQLSPLIGPDGRPLQGIYLQKYIQGLSDEQLTRMLVNQDFNSPTGQLVKSIIDSTLNSYGINKENGWDDNAINKATQAAYSVMPQAVGETNQGTLKDEKYSVDLQHQYNREEAIRSGEYPYIINPENPHEQIPNPAWVAKQMSKVASPNTSKKDTDYKMDTKGTNYHKIRGVDISKAYGNKGFQGKSIEHLEEMGIKLIGDVLSDIGNGYFNKDGSLKSEDALMEGEKRPVKKGLKKTYELFKSKNIKTKQDLINYLSDPAAYGDLSHIGLYEISANNTDADLNAAKREFCNRAKGESVSFYALDGTDLDTMEIVPTKRSKYEYEDLKNGSDTVKILFDYKTKTVYLGMDDDEGRAKYIKYADNRSLGSQMNEIIKLAEEKVKQDTEDTLKYLRTQFLYAPAGNKAETEKELNNYMVQASKYRDALISNLVAERIASHYLLQVKDDTNAVPSENN